MIRDVLLQIQKEVSGERAKSLTASISGFHRIPVSSGFRQAARFCVDTLQSQGNEAKLLAYPANEGVRFWMQKLFQEWNIRGAELRLVDSGERLCDYPADPLCVVQRSDPVDFRDDPLDIVCVSGDAEKALLPDDLRGKILFTDGPPTEIADWAFGKMGCAALISDHISEVFMPRPGACRAARLYTTFTRMDCTNDPRRSAFLLTPEQGERLRKLCARMLSAHRDDPSLPAYPRAVGFIDAAFCDGEMETVYAEIEGETDETVMVVGHLCHAKGCANDNASGCAGAIEAVRALSRLIGDGKLKKPRRKIALLLTPELVGTYAYLASNEAAPGKVVAAINLDMIGRRQEGKCGLIGAIGLPDSLPSFAEDVFRLVIEKLGCDTGTFNLDAAVSFVRFEHLEYMGGSDHHVFCDPTVGIPCVTMMQWLDDNYHTSLDTPDHIDADVLKRTVCVAAGYLYALAQLEPDEIPGIMNRTRARFANKLAEITDYDINHPESADAIPLGARIEQYRRVFVQATRDYLRFFPHDAAVADRVRKECDYINSAAARYARHVARGRAAKAPELEERYQLVPRRLINGPVPFSGFRFWLDEALRAEYDRLVQKYPAFFSMNPMNDFILHRVDGKSTVYDIAVGAAIEGRMYDPAYTFDYLTFLSHAGVIAFCP